MLFELTNSTPLTHNPRVRSVSDTVDAANCNAANSGTISRLSSGTWTKRKNLHQQRRSPKR